MDEEDAVKRRKILDVEDTIRMGKIIDVEKYSSSFDEVLTDCSTQLETN